MTWRRLFRIGCFFPFLIGILCAGTFEVTQVVAINPTKDNGYVESTLLTNADLPSINLYARIYYFSNEQKLIASASPVDIKRKGDLAPHPFPDQFHKNDLEKIRFSIPLLVRVQRDWSAVVVFGDKAEVSAGTVPATALLAQLEFPEKALLAKARTETVERVKYTDLMQEEVCLTTLPDYPRLTLFSKLPAGLAQGEKPAGVLCLVGIGRYIDDIRRMVMADVGGSDNGITSCALRYAQKNKLLVICWGSHPLWDPTKNWSDLTPAEMATADSRFDKVASAWEKGMLKLTTQYEIKPKDFLLCGFSGAAQFAARLALRKPQCFRAAYIHIPSSFDMPTFEASSILWCLTTGELESGYVRSIKFYKECKRLGYPIIYKAIPGLGHTVDYRATMLGLHWFDYARSLPDSPRERIKALARIEYSPPFIGDYLNQQMEPASTGQWIPEGQRVFLPTEVIAKAWNLEKVPDPSVLPPEITRTKPGSVVVKPVVETNSKPAAVATTPVAPVDSSMPKEWQAWLTKLNTAKVDGLSVRDWPVPPKGKIPEGVQAVMAEYDATVRKMREADAKLLFVFAQTMRAMGNADWPLPGEPQKPKVAEEVAPAKDPHNTVFGRKVME
jgi:predicted esterase